MTDDTPISPQRAPTTSVVLLALLAVAVGVGVWQDRAPEPSAPGETGMVAQVMPASEELTSLVTAPEPGALAPNFRLKLADGGVIELAELRGKPVFLNFWASWCFFCLTEMPAIQRVSEEYGAEVVILGVNVSDTPEDIALYAENNGIHYLADGHHECRARRLWRAPDADLGFYRQEWCGFERGLRGDCARPDARAHRCHAR